MITNFLSVILYLPCMSNVYDSVYCVLYTYTCCLVNLGQICFNIVCFVCTCQINKLILEHSTQQLFNLSIQQFSSINSFISNNLIPIIHALIKISDLYVLYLNCGKPKCTATNSSAVTCESEIPKCQTYHILY